MARNIDPEDQVPEELFPPVLKLTKDMKEAAKNLGPTEARFLVDAYYQMQDQRIRSAGQVRSMNKEETPEPHAVLDWLLEQSTVLEKQVHIALYAYAKSQDMGNWLMSICGVGPVIAAGLLAHIDWTKPTVGHIWRFAGLDPTSVWVKGKRRPWNASLKTLCWKVGESFVKQRPNKKDIYGKEYFLRKTNEITQNDQGLYAAQAKVKLEKVGKNTESWPWYAACYPAGTAAAYLALASVFPERDKCTAERAQLLRDRRVEAGTGVHMLPPNHINARARRWTVKLFLSHSHFVGLWLKTKRLAPNPYPIAFCGHAHVIPPPNLDEIVGLREAWEQRQRENR
jgi:hypothetical protein